MNRSLAANIIGTTIQAVIVAALLVTVVVTRPIDTGAVPRGDHLPTALLGSQPRDTAKAVQPIGASLDTSALWIYVADTFDETELARALIIITNDRRRLMGDIPIAVAIITSREYIGDPDAINSYRRYVTDAGMAIIEVDLRTPLDGRF